MCRKLILLVLALSFCLTSSLPAYTIIWVSDNKGSDNTDQGWIDLLVAEGYDVDLSFRNAEGRTLDAGKIDALNAADLIIVSRDTDSGSYDDGSEVDQWNSITRPLILQIAHIYRSSRWRWMDSTSTATTTANLVAVVPEHPIFAGVALDASNQVSILTAQSDVGDGTNPGNGTLLGERADNGGVWIAEWEEGVEFYTGSGQIAGGPRMYFAAGGSEGSNVDGRYNLTPEGETLFLNAVSYMIQTGIHLKAYDPNPEDGATDVVGPVLSWTPGTTAVFHDIYLGTDPTPPFKARQPLAWSMWFEAGGWIGGATYYWRIDEVEADGTTIHTGDVWSFTAAPIIAYNPDPPDGAKCVDTDADLSWTAAYNAIFHDVYFGTDETQVADGTGDTFKVNQTTTTYDPGTLAKETTYYWRIDEVEQDKTTKHTGEVWSFSTIPDIPITDPDLLCWWKFDEGEGTTALDWSGHDHHGTLAGDPQWVEGTVGGALEFDGLGDRVVDDDGEDFLNGLDAITVCMWIKSDLIGTDRGFINCEPPDGGDNYVTMRYDNAGGNSGNDDCLKMAVTTTSGESQLESSANLQVTEWQHVAMTWSSGGLIRLYINGVEDAGADRNNPNNTGTISGCSTLIIGAGSKDEDAPNEGWDGLIDDVRIFNKALTADEIKEVMRGEPDLAWNPEPANKSTTDIDKATPLSWSPGDKAAKHDVYFGTDKDAVTDADTSTPGTYRGQQAPTSYTPPEGVEFNQTYFWRIDEFNTDATVSKGRVWSFTVAEYLIVDDFEDYNDYCDRIFYTWPDGWGHNGDLACGVPPFGGNGSGSTVGYLSEPYAEQTITHDGSFQSMPFEYLNDGSTGKALYSETERTFDPPQDWTRHGVKALTLWLQGRAPSVGSFSYNPATQIYTLTANGDDIFGTADQFHFAYKQLSGVGTIEAQVLSITETDTWSKGGLMIRETLEPNSPFAAVYVTGSQGCRFQARLLKGDGAVSDSSVTQLAHIRAPHWIKLERVVGGGFNAYDSNDPAVEGWHPLAWNTQTITMAPTVYIGLALTSHNTDPTVVCTAEFSDVAMTGSVTGQWQSQDIGITSNDAEQLYVVVEDSAGRSKVVNHPDPGATGSDTWQEWNIDLREVSDASVNLQSVKKMYIGVGNRNTPTLGGGGMLYIDDIRLYPPRCIPSLVKPAADFDNDCKVDYPDLEILADNWLRIVWDPTGGHDGSGSIVFGPTGDYVAIQDLYYQGDDYVAVSVCAWIRTDSGADQYIASFDRNEYWRLEINGNGGGPGQVGWDVMTDTGQVDYGSATRVDDGQWHHVVGVFDDGTLTIYIDGIAESPATGGATFGTGNTRFGFLGANSEATVFDGARGGGNPVQQLDDFRIYDYALSAVDVARLAQGTGQPVTGPILWYKLDETSGSIAADSSGNGYDGHLMFSWFEMNLHDDATINFKDYAILADTWLDERLWP